MSLCHFSSATKRLSISRFATCKKWMTTVKLQLLWRKCCWSEFVALRALLWTEWHSTWHSIPNTVTMITPWNLNIGFTSGMHKKLGRSRKDPGAGCTCKFWGTVTNLNWWSIKPQQWKDSGSGKVQYQDQQRFGNAGYQKRVNGAITCSDGISTWEGIKHEARFPIIARQETNFDSTVGMDYNGRAKPLRSWVTALDSTNFSLNPVPTLSSEPRTQSATIITQRIHSVHMMTLMHGVLACVYKFWNKFAICFNSHHFPMW